MQSFYNILSKPLNIVFLLFSNFFLWIQDGSTYKITCHPFKGEYPKLPFLIEICVVIRSFKALRCAITHRFDPLILAQFSPYRNRLILGFFWI